MDSMNTEISSGKSVGTEIPKRNKLAGSPNMPDMRIWIN